MRVGQPAQYPHSPGALLTIWRQEGLLRGLYRGTTATMARAAALSGGQLAVRRPLTAVAAQQR